MIKKSSGVFLKAKVCAVGFFFTFAFIYSSFSLNWTAMLVFILLSTFFLFDIDVRKLAMNNRSFRLFIVLLSLLCLVVVVGCVLLELESKVVFVSLGCISFVYYGLLMKHLTQQLKGHTP
ncbi:hypothetical protein OPW41_16165 [Vibrio europaeus]|uniref:Uncharacterized protein n=1 Tax=Vibrio europaeus TaxID=300876 RepID=A0A178JCZ2_9VIBR|nr:hypothetical protein [Vibrio europaeus]MDC5703822.1 hypothetical protein [Vibrio europaeus]MDC5708224.1 hypothetical protein [Vibrio europaeus]MDC5714369.1 hypothetical protein [Vibrio europaeus]MDC5722570.1 hypothetical protein [Vibrio europaeus]MDC5727149.1 hypothetical protein [Vibrio europaeus]